MSEYVSPQDKLNNMINSPAPVETAGLDARTSIAMHVYGGTLTLLASGKSPVSQEQIKEMAVMAVDAADILVAQLAKGKR